MKEWDIEKMRSIMRMEMWNKWVVKVLLVLVTCHLSPVTSYAQDNSNSRQAQQIFLIPTWRL